MLKIARKHLLAASLAAFAATYAAIAFAQSTSSSSAGASDQSAAQGTASQTSSQPASSTQSGGTQANTQSGQPSANNPTNLPTTESGQTPQQSAAPVVDPHAAAQTPSGSQPQPGQPGTAQSANPQDWPAPQRYGSGGSSAASSQGAASLGVNIVSSADGQGILISRVRPGTAAEQMGLQPRDRILNLNGRPVSSVEEFISTIRRMNAGDQVELSIDRGGTTRSIAGRLEALREAIATGREPMGTMARRDRDVVGRERSSQFSDNYRPAEGNRQTSYEEGRQTNVRDSSEIEARLSRLEQQLDRLTREIQQIQTKTNPSPGTATQPGATSPPPATR